MKIHIGALVRNGFFLDSRGFCLDSRGFGLDSRGFFLDSRDGACEKNFCFLHLPFEVFTSLLGSLWVGSWPDIRPLMAKDGEGQGARMPRKAEAKDG